MPLFERPPLETLASAKDRWTPLYLEHGRLEVDDSSVKWIGAVLFSPPAWGWSDGAGEAGPAPPSADRSDDLPRS